MAKVCMYVPCRLKNNLEIFLRRKNGSLIFIKNIFYILGLSLIYILSIFYSSFMTSLKL